MQRQRYIDFVGSEQIDKVIELYLSNQYSYHEIAQKVNTFYNSDFWHYEKVRNVVRRYRERISKIDAESLLEELYDNNPNVEFGVVEPKTKHKNSVLVMSDLHIPFHRPDVIDIIKKHKGEISAIIFAGDILDCKDISSFPSLDDLTIETEIITALKFFHQVYDIVGKDVKIILHNGNHEHRWQRYIANMHSKKLFKFINPNILEMLKDGMTIYEHGKECRYEGIKSLIIINSWYVNYGNKLVTVHPFNFYSAPTKNATQAIVHLIDKGEEFQMLICAHNHHQAECPNHLGKYGIECGCLCSDFDYANGRTATRSQDYGYVVVVFDENGDIDTNATKLYKLKPIETSKVNTYVEM